MNYSMLAKLSPLYDPKFPHKNFIAYNSVTGRYWNGKEFAGAHAGEVATLTAGELAMLRATYDNVVVAP